MKKTLEILRLIAYYVLLFVFSSISSNFMPIGAIAMISAVYASGGILAPAIVLSAISIGVFVSIKSLLIFILYLILFLIPVIFIRPLISIEGRNEKKKIGNYLLIASFLSFVFFGFLEGVYAVFLTYILYKIFVNSMAVLRNEDQKIIFSKEESVGLFTLLSVGILYISLYFNLNSIIPLVLIFGILAYAGIKKGFVEGLLTYILTILIYYFLMIPSMKIAFNFELILNNILLLIIPIITIGLISLLRKFSRIIIYYSISAISIALFFVFYQYFQNLILYLPYLLMLFVVIIFAEDYESIKTQKIKNSNLISDEGETRLETPEQTQDILEKEKEKLKSREVIELFTDKDIFVNRMYINEESYKNLSLYDEIQSSDYIFEEIYDLIKGDGYINRLKFNKILLNNNIIIDIHNYETEEEIRILEILALRELKRVLREKEEKKVYKEREEALQTDKKISKNVEETDSMGYNKKIRNTIKKESIRDIFKNKN